MLKNPPAGPATATGPSGFTSPAAEAIEGYIKHAGLERGPLFRARASARSEKLGEKPISTRAMHALISGYLECLPGAVKDSACIFTPHSLRATTATLLLDAGVDIAKVQELSRPPARDHMR
jgi:integrase